jgi:hypothetical protein
MHSLETEVCDEVPIDDLDKRDYLVFYKGRPYAVLFLNHFYRVIFQRRKTTTKQYVAPAIFSQVASCAGGVAEHA